MNLFDHPDHSSKRRHFLKATMAAGIGATPLLLATDSLAANGDPQGPMKMPAMGGDMSSLEAAIKACMDCHSMCLRMAMTYCVEKGGHHAEAAHLRLLMNCAEICQTSANFMLSGSPLHGRVCAVCAEVCEACARNCEQLGEMAECAEECRRCAKSCKTMA
jgi:hypothetical protein